MRVDDECGAANVALSFRAPPDLDRKIEAAAARELISKSAFCRRAVARAVAQEAA